MIADQFLVHLNKVRSTGADRWQACCPAHDDRSPSLSIKLGEDGRLLVHCFAGCSAREVVESVGMGLADLFPSSDFDRDAYARQKQAEEAADRAVHDALIVKLARSDLAKNKPLTTSQQQEVAAAVRRLHGGEPT